MPGTYLPRTAISDAGNEALSKAAFAGSRWYFSLAAKGKEPPA